MRQPVRSTSQSYFWPVLWAVTLHALMFALLFISFSRTPDLPPARPIVQATLYQMKSQSQATSKTQQKIAGEAQKTAAKEYEIEQLEQRKAEEQRLLSWRNKNVPTTLEKLRRRRPQQPARLPRPRPPSRSARLISP